MNITQCQRCSSKFYISIPDSNACCPFCGYSLPSFELTEKRTTKREAERRIYVKNCIVENGFGILSAKTLDISQSGVGLNILKESSITALTPLPFSKDDKLSVNIKDIGMKKNAMVVWVNKHTDYSIRAGMRFC